MINDNQVKALRNLKGKHIKQLLGKLERLGVANSEVRKSVLDELNDLMRATLKELGVNED